MSVKNHAVLASAISFSLLCANTQAEDVQQTLVPRPAAGFFNATYFEAADIKDSEGVEYIQQDTHFKMTLGKVGEVESGLFAYGFNVRQRTIDIETPDGSGEASQTLYDISAPLTYARKADEDTTYIINLSPGFKSSLEYVADEDLAINAVAQVIEGGQYHSYAYGLVYTHAFGTGKFVPLASYTYKPNPKWQMALGFPVTYASYAPEWGENYFAKITPNGGSWHVYGDDKEDQFDIVQVGYRLGAGGQWKIKGPFWFEVEGGIQFGQELDLEDENGTKVDAKFENSGYLQLGINLHFSGPE